MVALIKAINSREIANLAMLYTAFAPLAFKEMSQLAKQKVDSLPHMDVQMQLKEFKGQYPVIYQIVTDGANDAECDKIRVDSFSDCRFTFEGVQDMELNEKEAFDLTEAIFTKCIAGAKQLCPLHN